ncbi:uncharacterized protein DUF4082 [Paenibacillus cellulosilyticus]|uniref:Uncharacterized protein DUF4082 n=1 Tax=Paenibacillus cellulosilyticus TaxID=375489 RepID=A0A2V2YXH1_9BACL|nr:DUF4082 domain-containing protein [Paenibacillus cellulosilyticus]PWW02860.1 uncharacterized protein DUF4082 [Paenibacillus cellulosilyticus]
MNLTATIIVNSASPNYNDYSGFTQPYLKQSGVPLRTVDRSAQRLREQDLDTPLIVLAHRNLTADGQSAWSEEEGRLLRQAQADGVGVVSFDDCDSPIAPLFQIHSPEPAPRTTLRFTNKPHYITLNHALGEPLNLQNEVLPEAALQVAGLEAIAGAEALLYADDIPYLFVKSEGSARSVQWAGMEWMQPHVRGPVWGLDDLFYRSLIWAARKPFVVRSMPRFFTLRVDDCVGDHGCYQNQVFEWVDIANRYGIKPWLGFFHETISEPAVIRMVELVAEGNATAQFHGVNLFGTYYANGDSSEEGIGQTIEQWFERHGGSFPLSSYFIPHAYDLSAEALRILPELGVKFVGMPYPANTGGGAKNRFNPWLQAGPFRTGLEGVDGTPWTGSTYARPLYYADWYETSVEGAPELFNVVSEVRDVNGYEWFNYVADSSQYSDVAGAIRRGTLILRRCHDSLVLGNLFTHEDSWRGKFIANIAPEHWEQMIAGIVSNMASEPVRYTTMDEAAEYVLALHQSAIGKVELTGGVLDLQLEGTSSCSTELTVYEESLGVIRSSTYSIDPFVTDITMSFKLEGANDMQGWEETLYTGQFPICTGQADHPMSLGTRFIALAAGAIVKARLYVPEGDEGLHLVRVWGVREGRDLIPPVEWVIPIGMTGWQELDLTAPVHLTVGQEVIVAITTRLDGEGPYRYAETPEGFSIPIVGDALLASAGAGLYAVDSNELPALVRENGSYFRDIVFQVGNDQQLIALKNDRKELAMPGWIPST